VPVSLTFTVDNPNLKLMFRAPFNGMLFLILAGCATHPTISPVPLEAGETYLGYTLSVENAMPFVFYRRGMSANWDVGLRLGIDQILACLSSTPHRNRQSHPYVLL